MPISRIFLGFPESTDVAVRRSALGTLGFVAIDLVEATLVERVLAQEMDGWEIQAPATGCTSSGLEYSRLVS